MKKCGSCLAWRDRFWLLALLGSFTARSGAAQFDAAPFGLALPEGNGIYWEDSREIHKVIAHFNGPAPAPERVKLQYWGSRWPEQHLPKTEETGSGASGWMELGNWYQSEWRNADTEAKAEGDR